jgi:DNA-binding GntR family transcriptional regulator
VTLLALPSQPDLIDQVHDRLVAAVVDGTLLPGQRLTQDELATMLGVSRQPVSHAIQVLRRRGLLVDVGKRGIAVAPIDGKRIRDLYQIRAALDGLAAALAAGRRRAGALTELQVISAQRALERGTTLPTDVPMAILIDADVAFHAAVHELSGNGAIAETVNEQWPHFRRSMQVALALPGMRARVWAEHNAILAAILAGDATTAGELARTHTERAGEDTARQLDTAARGKTASKSNGEETP